MSDDLPFHDVVPAGVPGPREVVEVTTYWLEMTTRPTALAPATPDGVQVVRAHPSTRFYRYLYDSVGGPWHWYDRRRMPPEELQRILDDPAVEVWVLWERGVPQGYIELDRREPGEVEIAYFGVMPEAIGRRLGSWLLAWGIAEAWRPSAITRLWVHTCSLDHPSALAVYLQAGFSQYHQTSHRQTIAAGGA